MRTRRAIELTVGIGLLLGPLVYALTLEPEVAGECDATPTAAVGEAGEVREIVVVHRCEAPEPSEPAAEPEPASEPEPEPVAELEPEPEPEPGFELANFLFVTDAGLVLSTEAERSWGTGRLFEPAGTVTYRAAKRAKKSAIPAEHLGQRARTFDLFGADGKVCTARIGELQVVSQYDGEGLVGLLGEDWDERDAAEASTAQIRAGLWQRNDLWLVATLESDQSCKGALWARDAVLPPPVILRRSDAPTHASSALLAAFAQSERRAEIERNYRATYEQLAADQPEALVYTDDWEAMAASYPATAWSWLGGDGQPQLVGLEFGTYTGCGDPFDAAYTTLELVEGDSFLAVERGHDAVTIIDVDLDGRFEFLYGAYNPRRLESATFDRSLSIEEDWYCPC